MCIYPWAYRGENGIPALGFFFNKNKLKGLSVAYVVKLEVVGDIDHMDENVTFYTSVKAVY